MSVWRTLNSSIGAKWTMALTGLGLVGFVIVHMIGNLQVFAGPDKLNYYAETLQSLGPVLWAMRLGLLAMFGVHVWTAFKLTSANRAARPVPYATMEPQVTSYAARTMIWSGIIVLAFLVYHLAHFTLGWTNPEHFAHQELAYAAAGSRVPDVSGLVAPAVAMRPDVYARIVLGFQVWWIVAIYVAAQVFLCLHISHGASSALHTLGVTHPALRGLKAKLGPALALIIFLGNCSIPVSVFLGLVK